MASTYPLDLLGVGNLCLAHIALNLAVLPFFTYFDVSPARAGSIQRRFIVILEPLLLLLHPLYLSPHKVSRFP